MNCFHELTEKSQTRSSQTDQAWGQNMNSPEKRKSPDLPEPYESVLKMSTEPMHHIERKGCCDTSQTQYTHYSQAFI